MKMISSKQKVYLFHNLSHSIKEVRQDDIDDIYDTESEKYFYMRNIAHR